MPIHVALKAGQWLVHLSKIFNGKGAGIYSYIKCEDSSSDLHVTFWSLNLFMFVPFQLHEERTVLPSFRRLQLIIHIVISVLPDTYLHLSQVNNVYMYAMNVYIIILF